MTPPDVEKDAYREYRGTDHTEGTEVPAKPSRSLSRRERRARTRNESAGIPAHRAQRPSSSKGRGRDRGATISMILSTADLVRDRGFLGTAQKGYRSLIKSHGDQVTVHLSELQQLNLEYFRGKLVAHAFHARYNTKNYDLDGSIRDFTTYVDALRDFEYMTELRRRHPQNDPFFVSTEWALQRELIQDIFNAELRLMDDGDAARMKNDLKPLWKQSLGEVFDVDNVKRFWKTRTEIIQTLEQGEYFKKVGMAVLGESFLIGPMLIMVLHPGLVTSLVTTSVCVFAFGLGIARFLEKPFDVLSGTAAYAAVLVVFVGTSGTSA